MAPQLLISTLADSQSPLFSHFSEPTQEAKALPSFIGPLQGGNRDKRNSVITLSMKHTKSDLHCREMAYMSAWALAHTRTHGQTIWVIFEVLTELKLPSNVSTGNAFSQLLIFPASFLSGLWKGSATPLHKGYVGKRKTHPVFLPPKGKGLVARWFWVGLISWFLGAWEENMKRTENSNTVVRPGLRWQLPIVLSCFSTGQELQGRPNQELCPSLSA